MKKTSPKRIYARILADDKISVGEYVNGKWHNIVDPFKPSDDVARQDLKRMAKLWRERQPNRPIEVTAYQGNIGAAEIVERIIS